MCRHWRSADWPLAALPSALDCLSSIWSEDRPAVRGCILRMRAYSSDGDETCQRGALRLSQAFLSTHRLPPLGRDHSGLTFHGSTKPSQSTATLTQMSANRAMARERLGETWAAVRGSQCSATKPASRELYSGPTEFVAPWAGTNASLMSRRRDRRATLTSSRFGSGILSVFSGIRFSGTARNSAHRFRSASIQDSTSNTATRNSIYGSE